MFGLQSALVRTTIQLSGQLEFIELAYEGEPLHLPMGLQAVYS